MRNILFKAVRTVVYGFPVVLFLCMLSSVGWKNTLEGILVVAGVSFILLHWDKNEESRI